MPTNAPAPEKAPESADIAEVLAQLEALRDNTLAFSQHATSGIAGKAFDLIESLRQPEPSERAWIADALEKEREFFETASDEEIDEHLHPGMAALRERERELREAPNEVSTLS